MRSATGHGLWLSETVRETRNWEIEQPRCGGPSYWLQQPTNTYMPLRWQHPRARQVQERCGVRQPVFGDLRGSETV